MCTFEGEYYRTQDATIYDKPGQPVPIYVAAAGPAVAKYAGRGGDGFICTSGKKWDLRIYRRLCCCRSSPRVHQGGERAQAGL